MEKNQTFMGQTNPENTQNHSENDNLKDLSKTTVILLQSLTALRFPGVGSPRVSHTWAN